MCLYPKYIKNPKYKANKKNGGIIPPVSDPRVLYVPVGCQNCLECRKQKSREWRVRLLEDIKHNTNGKWITLTFSNKSYTELSQEFPNLKGYTLDNAIATLAVRRFLERWRKKYKKSLRHWLVTELGHNGTENIHLHGFIWTTEPIEILDKYWQYGYTWKGKYNTRTSKYYQYVNSKTVNYTVKYVHKMDFKHKMYKSIILTSAGIGGQYKGKHNAYMGSNTDETYRTNTGHKMALPIYWRNKIYNDDQREQLWLIKLDKQERFVLGQKISIKDGQDQYFRMLDSAREKNREMGYSSNYTNHDAIQYELDRRAIMQQTRLVSSFNRKERSKMPPAAPSGRPAPGRAGPPS